MALIDKFSQFPPAFTMQPGDGFAITKSDTVDLDQTTRYIYVGGGGSVSVITISGTTVVFAAVPVGTILPIRATRVLAATSATNLVGLV